MMYLLKRSDHDFVARPTVRLARAAIEEEGYTLVGECDEHYNVTKPLDKLPSEKAPKAEPKGKAKKEEAQ
jgi:hypothetical protein